MEACNQHKRMAMGKSCYKDGGLVEEEKSVVRAPKEQPTGGLLRQAVDALTGRNRKQKLDDAIEASSGETERQRKMREASGFKSGGRVKKGGK